MEERKSSTYTPIFTKSQVAGTVQVTQRSQAFLRNEQQVTESKVAYDLCGSKTLQC